jgi:hypothetical protein
MANLYDLWRQQALAQGGSGYVNPLEIQANSGNSNLFGILPTDPNPSWYRYSDLLPNKGYTLITDEEGRQYWNNPNVGGEVSSIFMKDEDNTDLAGVERSRQAIADTWTKGISPLSYDQFDKAFSYVKGSDTKDFIDLMGRVISPGSKVWNSERTGYFEYQPPSEDIFGWSTKVATVPDDPDNTTSGPGAYAASWKWTPVAEGAQPPEWNKTMYAAGVFPDKYFGGTIGQGGWNAIKGVVSTMAPGISQFLGAAASGATGTLGGSTITIGDAIASGATASDLAAMGFTTTDIALNASGVAANSLSNATGLSTGASNSLVNIGTSAATGAIKSSVMGGDPLTGALAGGASGLGGTITNSLSSPSTPSSTGGVMSEYNDPFGWDAGGLDYSYDSNIAGLDTGGASAMGWVRDAAGNINWGPILAAGVTAGIGALGATAAAGAANSGLNNATNATNAAAQSQIQAQERMYQQGRQDFAPFREMAPRSLATLQSSIYGTPETYRNATGGMETANAEQFDLKNFTPEGTPAYEWQKKRGLEDLRTQLMMMGRPSGTVAANANSRFLGDLNAKEYETGYNRLFNQKQDYVNNLLNLVKTSQGAAGTTSALGATAANNTSSALQNQGNTLANISNAQGQTNANLYSGLASLPLNIANTAIKANQSGMF